MCRKDCDLHRCNHCHHWHLLSHQRATSPTKKLLSKSHLHFRALNLNILVLLPPLSPSPSSSFSSSSTSPSFYYRICLHCSPLTLPLLLRQLHKKFDCHDGQSGILCLSISFNPWKSQQDRVQKALDREGQVVICVSLGRPALSKFSAPCTELYLFFKSLFIWLHWVLVAAHELFNLVWGVQDLVPWPGVKPRPPSLGVWSLSHWTTWEVPPCLLMLTL